MSTQQPTNTKCPYCKHDFGKPIGRRVCPACENQIVVRAGRPVTEPKAKAIDDKREADAEAAWLRECEKIRRQAVAATKRDLRQYKQEGETKAVIQSTAICCDNCRAMNGRVFIIDAILDDPPVPVKNCTNDICQCSMEITAESLRQMAEHLKNSGFTFTVHTEKQASVPASQSSRSAPVSQSSGCSVYLLSGLMLTALVTYVLVYMTP